VGPHPHQRAETFPVGVFGRIQLQALVDASDTMAAAA
jgi:hypothetical protein